MQCGLVGLLVQVFEYIVYNPGAYTYLVTGSVVS